MGPLKDAIAERFPWLTELGFRMTRHAYDPRAMGSSLVDLESDRLKLRFMRDRGVIWLEVAAPSYPEGWIELRQLWITLTGYPPEPELDGWAWFFRDNQSVIEQALGPDLEKTRNAIALLREANESAVARYTAKFKPPLYKRILSGPLGWVVAAFLLIWIVVR